MIRVALVDPSLFTLPYDTALARGLEAVGVHTVLHSRAPRADDGSGRAPHMVSSFYKLSENQSVQRLPRSLRLAVKGADHIASMRNLIWHLRRTSPDIIHFQWLPLPLVDAGVVRKLRSLAPVVLTVHDTSPFNGSPTAVLQKAGFLRALRACDRLIVHTAQGFERLLAMGVEEARVWLLPHGPLIDGKEDVPADSFAGMLTFVLFGKIKAYKGADLLLEAFARLPEHLRAQARVRVVGKPYMDLEDLKNRAEWLGVRASLVLEPRFVADTEIPGIFAPGSIAVFPYREIEASGVLSLALAFARPVLASRLGNFAETLTDGVHGRLVPTGDIQALSSAMAEMIEDRARTASFSRAVCQLARNAPSWAEIAAQMRAYYGSLLSSRQQDVTLELRSDHAITEVI